jgi:hypothetical protein
MWKRLDNQDVGLEAAIIKRVRNSSLVKCFCAENVTGLKSVTEAMASGRITTVFYSGKRCITFRHKFTLMFKSKFVTKWFPGDKVLGTWFPGDKVLGTEDKTW